MERALTGNEISEITPRMGRKKINDEQMPARFPAGTMGRIDAVLTDGEKRSDFVRSSVDREIARRTKEKCQS